MDPQKLIEQLDRWESLPLALATRFGPWLTPLVPALFVQRALVAHLRTPPAWGWLAALSLELVGIAATNALLRAHAWERERRKSDPPAPLFWHFLAAAAYYFTALLLVLVMEFFPPAARLAPAMFVLLAGASALVLALSGDQRRREQLARTMSARRSANRSTNRSTNRSANPSATPRLTVSHPDRDGQSGDANPLPADPLAPANRSRKARQRAAERALRDLLTQHPTLSHAKAGRLVGRSRSWVSGKLAEWERAGLIRRNGQGVQFLQSDL